MNRCFVALASVSLFFTHQQRMQADERQSGTYDPLVVAAGFRSEVTDLTVHDATRRRDVPLRVYLPAERTPAPIVLFSHGLGGNREGNGFLGRHWAARGYIAVFLQHPGSDDSIWKDKPLRERGQAMFDAVAPLTAAKNLLLRAQDVTATLDQLAKWNDEAGHVLAGRVDLTRVGMTGHSFGAATTQAVSGQKMPIGAELTDERIKAAIIYSPNKPVRGDLSEAFGGVNVPWLLMTGTKDVAEIAGKTLGNQSAESRLAVYAALPAGRKYELLLHDANHMAFTDTREFGGQPQRNPKHHPAIIAISTAFLDAFVRDDAAAAAWLNSDAPRTLLDEKDRWQKK